jgi:hypothetical protein
MKRLTLAFALMLSVASGGLLVTLPTGVSAQDAPVDCKKTPEHPRCADKK